MTRERSNALTKDDPRRPNWLKDDYVMPVPNAGSYSADPSGYIVHRGQRHHATEGWKFHVSAFPHSAETIAQIVLPVLQQLDVYHKYLELKKLPSRIGVEVGKFIAYYPISPNDAHQVAGAVGAALMRAALGESAGPAIQDELAFGPTKLLYTRYGSYAYEFVMGPPPRNPDGTPTTKSMDPPRGFRDYHKSGRVRPSWIPDLLTDQSNTLFPKYDARRTLHTLPESTDPWAD